ncbi:NXPE family member 1-like [Lissotriton helveticus]
MQIQQVHQKNSTFWYVRPSNSAMLEGKALLKTKQTAIDQEIDKIFNRIQQMIPNVTYTHKDQTSSAENSQITLIDPKQNYCVGDQLTIRIDVFDYFGNRKKYGGDLFIGRAYSPELGAGTSGKIEDFNNGTYHVHFTLFWEGKVNVSLLLLHPSEANAAIWKARNQGYENVDFTGTFTNQTHSVKTECNFQIQTKKQLCEYVDERDGEYFCCVKPDHMSCDSFASMMSVNNDHSYLSDVEKSLIVRSNIGKEMKKPIEDINVLQCNKGKTSKEEICRTGMHSPFPGGHFLQNIWNPLGCSMSPSSTKDLMDKCLPGKMIYLMGDSTLRQWMSYFLNNVQTLKPFNVHEKGLHGTIRYVDVDKNIQLQWIRHGHPFLTESVYNVKSLAYVPREIDKLVGGENYIIVVTIGHHFRPFPLSLFLRRVISVRKAVERLLARSPDSKIIVKTANIREHSADIERLSDFHGYIHYLATKQIFRGLNIGFVDSWDMTIASASYFLHPIPSVVENHVQMFLTYIC